MKHSPLGPSTLPRLRRCPGSYHAILAAKEAGEIPWETPPKEYNIQGQKEHDACYAIATAKGTLDVKVKIYNSLLESNQEAIDRVELALEEAFAIIGHVKDSCMMDEPIIEFEESSDPKHFFKTFLKDKLADLPTIALDGTCDIMIADKENGVLYIIDYKFGWVDVDIKLNDQLLAYALGAAGKWFTKREPPTEIHTIVIQPQNKEVVKRAVYDFDRLMRYAVETYFETIDLSLREEAMLNPSEKNCLFCELDGICRAQADECRKAFKDAPVEALHVLDDEELGRIAKSVPLIRRWISAVEKQCQARQIAGREIPSRKLARRNKHRRWLDEEKALKFLAARGIKKENREIVKPPSPSRAEKLLQNVSMTKRGWTMFNKLWEKPEGELISVPIDDPRPEVSVEAEIKEAFMEVDPDEMADEETNREEVEDENSDSEDLVEEFDEDDDFI